MGKNIFYAHAGSGNHGCEAIVRASAKLLNEDIVLYSARPEEDCRYDLQNVIETIEHDRDKNIRKYSPQWFASRIETKMTGAIDKTIYYRKQNMFDNVTHGDIAFSIGGDNYCYPGTEILAAQNSLFKKKGAKTVLWGCSVEPKLLENSSVAKDLASYDLIVSRESISYEAIKKVNDNTVLIPDPAFTLSYIDCPLPKGWIEGNMIGINASPLILQSGTDSDLVLDAYIELIQYILAATDCSVVLIPHVVWDSNDDRIPLKKLFDEFRSSGRVILLDDYNCMELKGFIRRCRMFVGARTHATIAAYSSCVPTLVLGYSVKSRGIAKDLFGTEDNYVLSVQKLNKKDELKNSFVWLMTHEDEIRKQLEQKMPDYKKEFSALFPAMQRLNGDS